MAFNITVEVYGVDEVVQWAAKLPQMTQAQTRQTFRAWGQQMVDLGRKVSPKDKLRGTDPRRRPVEESFAEQWRFEVADIAQHGVELRVGNIDPRLGLIIHDTPPRAIPRSVTAQLAKGYPMRFYWRGLEWTAWKISGGVAARGTKAQPAHEWVIRDFNVDSHLNELTRNI